MSKASRPRYASRGGARVNMGTIASVSRSSGLEQDGDTLKDYGVQEKYRDYIQGKLDELWKSFPTGDSEPPPRQHLDAQENVLILFRKLREGISASQRVDSFAIEVYETSLYLSILFDSPRQVASISSHLVSTLYLTAQMPQPRRHLSILISLLYYLLSAYPSQGLFYDRLHCLPRSFLPKSSLSSIWLSSLTSSLRSRNYVKSEELTRRAALADLIRGPSTEPSPSAPGFDLVEKAFYCVVGKLRTTSRNATWLVIRSAYRELSFSAGEGQTRDWLSRSLVLRSIVPGVKDVAVEEWLQEKIDEGHVKAKGDLEGKYIICKGVMLREARLKDSCCDYVLFEY